VRRAGRPRTVSEIGCCADLAAFFGGRRHAGLFDVQRSSELNGAGTIDHLDGFDDLTGELVYVQPTPWTTNGVTYTSDLNIVLGLGVGMGVASNVVSTEFGAPLVAQLAAADAFTLFGVDVSLIGEKVPVSLVVSTNLGSYPFPNLDIPLATAGRRFIGVALSRPGEYLTGFRFTIQSPNATVLLDNVAVGHVGVVGVHNADPDATAGGPYDALEGSEVAFVMSGTDPDGDALTFTWDLGDGTTGTGPTPPAGHTYVDDGSYDIMLTVADGRGGVDTAWTTATIANVAPALGAFSVPTTAVMLTPAGVAVPVSSTFMDPGSLDTHTATLDCGVGARRSRWSMTCQLTVPPAAPVRFLPLVCMSFDSPCGTMTARATPSLVPARSSCTTPQPVP
jgi:hypothetical protein